MGMIPKIYMIAMSSQIIWELFSHLMGIMLEHLMRSGIIGMMFQKELTMINAIICNTSHKRQLVFFPVKVGNCSHVLWECDCD